MGVVNLCNLFYCIYTGSKRKGKTDDKDSKKEDKTEPGSLTEPGAHQALGVLGIALIAMGEDIGSEMSLRTFNHLVSCVINHLMIM